MTHPGNRTEDGCWIIIHAEGVLVQEKWAGIIIHAGGVRGDFPSSAPKARVCEQ
jgi:hypothetical protein